MSTSNSIAKVPALCRLKDLLKNLALSAFVLLLCLAVAEFVLRLMGYGNIEIYEPDPLVYWRLKPNQNCFTKIDHKPVHVNSHGTRGREFTERKPANTIRIVTLGDSRTFGWGLSDEQTYSAILEKNLQERAGASKRIEVINCGVNAWSFPQMNVYLREYALKWSPDLVILGDANLWTQFSENSDPRFVRKFLSRVRLKNTLRRFALYHYIVEVQLQNYYQQYKSRFVPVDPAQDKLFKEQQKSDPARVFRVAIEGICAVAQTNKVGIVLLFLPIKDRLIGTSNPFSAVRQAKQQVAQVFGIPLLDVTEDMRPRARELYLEGDSVHLNAASNEMIARRLSDFVAPILKL